MEIQIDLTLRGNNYIGCIIPTKEHKFLHPETGEALRGNLIFEADSPFEVFKNLMYLSNTIKERKDTI
jgi:hypothetical protein